MVHDVYFVFAKSDSISFRSFRTTTQMPFITTSKAPEYCPFKRNAYNSPCDNTDCMYNSKSLECQMVVKSYCAKYNDVSSIEAGDDGCLMYLKSLSTTTMRGTTTTTRGTTNKYIR